MNKFNTHFYTIKNISLILLISFYNFISADSFVDKLNIPDGFEISIYADNLDSPRQLTETDKGYVVAGSKKGDKLFALHDIDSDGYAEKRILLAENLQNPTGVTFHNGDLYFAEIDTIWVIRDIDKLVKF